MLKIKDNVDLKELEKFGFEKEKYGDRYEFNHSNYDITLYVEPDRKIIIRSGEYSDCESGERVEPKLYDLIKADLVDKM